MNQPIIYDVAGIGIGPFNLGFAALTDDMPQLKCIFFERNKSFDWHPGMMLDFATLQVPFFADLVTTADPCNRFSFISYLKQNNRLFQFAIKEDNYISRREYNLYCQWVASRLTMLCFSTNVTGIYYDEELEHYEIETANINTGIKTTLFSRKLLIGAGNVPYLPPCCQGLKNNHCFHSAAYLYHKAAILQQESVTVIGSGQSAAEIFYDLLLHNNCFPGGIHWFSRSNRFFPMDTSKLSFEMTSPDYIDHFYRLSAQQKKKTLNGQSALYKGINQELLAAIYKQLYQRDLYASQPPVRIAANFELQAIDEINAGEMALDFFHMEEDKHVRHATNAVIAATGYKQHIPDCLENIKDRIRWNEEGLFDVQRHYTIDKNDNEIFVQNAELHTHGFSAPDLGMGAYRNAIIINKLLGYEHFLVEKKIAFQSFGTANAL